MDDAERDIVGAAESTPHRSRALSARRLVLRLATALAVLVAIDVALIGLLPSPDYEDDYRMPRALPTARLSSYVEHVETVARTADRPVVAFLGASPTWGDAVADGHDTVVAAFSDEAARRSASLRAYNLACNGQLLGDQYFIARRLADDADLLVVQLTYHSFNPAWRDGAKSRYPELASMLGVVVDADLADSLDRTPTRTPDLTGEADRWLADHWRLYGARDELAASLLGATPESRLFGMWQAISQPGFEGDASMDRTDRAYDDLEPDEQMLILDEFSDAFDFRIDPKDSEIRLLERLAADLETSGTPVVFYLSPVNTGALESYDLFDPNRHEANVALVRSAVEARGHRFLDLSQDSVIPPGAFADISHTTAAGNELVARELWNRTSDLVRAAP